ncbi:transmembrane protein 272-like isoform X1 [Cyclopterus lumpus]|uniref:transmembrane protein 272-like isoform X1 n=1 Tax=Cyclopterus lumpus TaxID=8103 RepID=UPI00148632D2|nr:transmembrane protein 272-like isoform X1 [Cyclopterus lumpus]
MNPSPHVEVRPQSAVMISSLVVVNIIWWMVMIAAIGLGATHLSRCPVQPNIPIYLIVLGASNLLSLSLTYTRNNWGDDMASIMCSACMAILHFFTFIWFFIGTSWIYPVYPPDYTPGTLRHCHKTTYQFAFVVTTLVWVATTLMFICSCCFALLTCCKMVISGHRLIPNRYTFYGATSDSHEPAGGDV